jgi:hypothetical protein
MSDNSGNVIIGAVLLGAAYLYYTKSTSATAAANAATYASGGLGSMPGSVGTGVSQILGGLFGNMVAPQSGGGTSTGAPVSPVDSQQPVSAGDLSLNNTDSTDPSFVQLPSFTIDSLP